MNLAEFEDLYIRSLDAPLHAKEKELLENELKHNSDLAEALTHHNAVRNLLYRKEPATFGPYFAAKVIHKIQQAGSVIDQQIFTFFKKFQLAAIGIIMALIVVNIIFTDEPTIPSILGLDTAVTTDEEIVSINFLETLTDNL
ncbi:MAG: hypothetical protein JNM57_14875 [Cyclobacteriaceae bacterium]|nr:hypothetical protein [Cyclobacteriaceae bacterium]